MRDIEDLIIDVCTYQQWCSGSGQDGGASRSSDDQDAWLRGSCAQHELLLRIGVNKIGANKIGSNKTKGREWLCIILNHVNCFVLLLHNLI